MEPTIEPWHHFYETKASVLQEHLVELGVIEFEPECSMEWREYQFDELVSMQALAAGGCLLTAPAGAGKTYLARHIARYLQAAGQTVHCVAPTHVAARLCGGKTIAHCKHWVRQLNAWFIVDEVSMVSVEDLGIMSSWRAVGARFIFVGDFDGQLLPFIDRWSDDRDVQSSQLMNKLCGGTHVHLEVYRRGTDPELFRFYTALYGSDKTTAAGAVWSAVRQGLSKYPWDGTLPDVCLALSHKTRIKVNELLNERAALAVEAKGLATWQLVAPLKCFGVTMQPQDFKLWVGAELLGCTRGREKKVLNAVTYRVVDITGDQVRLIVGEEFQTKSETNTNDILKPKMQRSCGSEAAIAFANGSDTCIYFRYVGAT